MFKINPLLNVSHVTTGVAKVTNLCQHSSATTTLPVTSEHPRSGTTDRCCATEAISNASTPAATFILYSIFTNKLIKACSNQDSVDRSAKLNFPYRLAWNSASPRNGGYFFSHRI